jgi:hypothetical protein
MCVDIFAIISALDLASGAQILSSKSPRAPLQVPTTVWTRCVSRQNQMPHKPDMLSVQLPFHPNLGRQCASDARYL